LDSTAGGICDHHCPAHPDWTPCQLAPGHDPAGGHRDSAGADVQHAWQDHGHDGLAAALYAAADAWEAESHGETITPEGV